MTLRLVCYVFALACLGASLHRRTHPLAVLFSIAFTVNLARLLPLPPRLDVCLFLAWPAALGACTTHVLAGWPPFLPTLALAVLVSLADPSDPAPIYFAAEVVSGAASVTAAISWFRSDRPADRAAVSCLVLAFGHPVIVLAGAYRVDPYAAWYLHQAGYAVLLLAVLAVLLVPRASSDV